MASQEPVGIYHDLPEERRPTPQFIKHCLECRQLRLLLLPLSVRPHVDGVENPMLWLWTDAQWYRPRCPRHTYSHVRKAVKRSADHADL
jgi:hypothetical protein